MLVAVSEVKLCQADMINFSLAVVCELPRASLHAANNLRPFGVV